MFGRANRRGRRWARGWGAAAALTALGPLIAACGGSPAEVDSSAFSNPPASCGDAPRPGSKVRPGAIAVLDPATGNVRSTAVVGDVGSAVLVGDIVAFDSGDGWVRGLQITGAPRLAWCYRAQSANSSLKESALSVAGDTVVVAEDTTVAGLHPASGARLWSVPVPGGVASFSRGREQAYAWIFDPPGGAIRPVAGRDGTSSWPAPYRPCTGSEPCAIPASPDRVVEAGDLVVLEASSRAVVVGLAATTGEVRWQIPGRAVLVAASGDLAILYQPRFEGPAGGALTGVQVDGSTAFQVEATGHAMVAGPGLVLMLDQRVGAGGPQGGPPKSTALVARSPRDGSTVWTAEVPGLPQRIGLASALALTSSGKTIAAVTLADGTVAWSASLETPARGGDFSVTADWQLLGESGGALILLGMADRPHRD